MAKDKHAKWRASRSKNAAVKAAAKSGRGVKVELDRILTRKKKRKG